MKNELIPGLRCANCSQPGRYVRTRNFEHGVTAEVYECANPSCAKFNLIWHANETAPKLTVREAHGLLRGKLEVDGHPALVARYAAGLIILGGLIEYDALVAGYRRVGALVVSKVPLSMRGEERRFVPIHRTKDWESTRALWLSDGSSVG